MPPSTFFEQRTGNPLLCLGKHKGDSVEVVAMHPSGKLAVSVGKKNEMKVWDLQTGKQAATSRVPLKDSLVAEWDTESWGILFACIRHSNISVSNKQFGSTNDQQEDTEITFCSVCHMYRVDCL